jgi:hypothetical protein
MNSPALLRLSAAAIAVALLVMLLCCVRPTPRTLALFLGLGLPAALAGMVGFGLYVLRDLRRRRAL